MEAADSRQAGPRAAPALLVLPKRLVFEHNSGTPLASLDLSLWAHAVTDSSLSSIAGWSSTALTALNLDHSTGWTPVYLKHLLDCCPNLRQLSAHRSPCVTSDALAACRQSGLRRLRVSDCPNLGDGALQQLRGNTVLQALDVSGCTTVTYTDINIVLSTCEALETLHMGGLLPLSHNDRKLLGEGIRSSRTLKDLFMPGLEGLETPPGTTGQTSFFDHWVSASRQMRSLDLSR